jgi:hypothetical protein
MNTGIERLLLLCLTLSTPAFAADVKVVQAIPTSVRLEAAPCRTELHPVPANTTGGRHCQSGWLTLHIRNDGEFPATVSVVPELRYANGGEIGNLKITAAGSVRPKEARRVWVHIGYAAEFDHVWSPSTNYPVQLEVKGEEAGGAFSLVLTPITVQTAQRLDLTSVLLWSSLGLAAVLVFIAVFSHQGLSLSWLRQPLGPPSFSPGASLASTLAMGATVLSGFLGFTAIPGATNHLSRNTYTAMSLIFAAFILVAPVIFIAIRKRVAVPVPDPNDLTNNSGFGLQGFLGTYILSILVNLWGVLGQMGLMLLLVDELQLTGLLPPSTVLIVQALFAAVVVFLAIYAVRTVRQQSGVSAEHETIRAAATASLNKLPPEQPAPSPPPAPKWSLL